MIFEVETIKNDVGHEVHEVRQKPSNVLLGVYAQHNYHEALVRATFLQRMHDDCREAGWASSPGMYIEACFSAYVRSMRLIGSQALTRTAWESAVATAPRHQHVHL